MDGLTTADGRRLAYRRAGSGPMLVCHPGGPGFSSLYLGKLSGLGEHLELVLIDPRGTGGSDPPYDRRAFAIDDYVSDLEELRAHLGLERMLLFGHSHGGMVAMAYAAAHPLRVRRLVLSSTLARFGPDQEAAMRTGMEKRLTQPWAGDAIAALEQEQAGQFESDQQLSELVFRELPLYFAHFGPAEAGYLDTLKAETINADALKLFNKEIFTTFDLRERLGSIKSPALVVTGDEDFICGPICAEEICAGIGEARMVIVGDAGHQVFVEQPQAFHDEVADFLGS